MNNNSMPGKKMTLNKQHNTQSRVQLFGPDQILVYEKQQLNNKLEAGMEQEAFNALGKELNKSNSKS